MTEQEEPTKDKQCLVDILRMEDKMVTLREQLQSNKKELLEARERMNMMLRDLPEQSKIFAVDGEACPLLVYLEEADKSQSASASEMRSAFFRQLHRVHHVPLSDLDRIWNTVGRDLATTTSVTNLKICGRRKRLREEDDTRTGATGR